MVGALPGGKTGFKILAGIHSDTIPSHICEDCNTNGECSAENPAAVPVAWENQDGLIFYNCPIHFVPDNVLDWYLQFTYEKNFHTAPPYTDRSMRFIRAMYKYEEYLKYWSNYKGTPKILDAKGIKALWRKKSR